MTNTRLSDELLEMSFSYVVLLSEPLQASLDEILDAADEDYPKLNWGYTANSDAWIDTRHPTSVSDTTDSITISCEPGRFKQDWAEELGNSEIFFPRVAEAIADHTDYLCISFKGRAGDTSCQARFRAARQLTCLTAVLAKLPIATAVYVPTAEKLVHPTLWAEAAEDSLADEVPVLKWMTIGVREYEDANGDPLAVSAYTIGLAPFLGREFVVPRIKCPSAEAEVVLAGFVSMAFEATEPLQDGEKIGFALGDESFRVRHCAEGVHDAPTDQVWFLHKTSDVNDRKLLGRAELDEAEEAIRTRSAKFRSDMVKRVAARV